MNFGGPFQNGQHQNIPPFNPMAQGLQPPPAVMPTMYPGMPVLPMPSVHPGMMPAPPLQTSYPEGQGPLAGRPVQRGSNGLLQAPEPDGPEEHEALQYIKLNPAEELEYNEYWTQACEGAETVSGAHAVEFLSRAAKVSKGQLRRIWDIADHRKEGALDQKQFFVALRLLALAQRGAELSIAGLRNFTGIQLIPSIDPPPKKEPEEPAPGPAPQEQKPLFSWTISAEVAARYDGFFKSLDTRNAGVIDGKQGVTFFGKSGLPRPTLKKIWGLADVTQDGLLSLDEFRTAMHMVTCIRNKRLTVTGLPNMLDPNGPNWLRIAGADPLAQPPPSQPNPAPPSPSTIGPHPPQTRTGHSPQAEHPLSPPVNSSPQQAPVIPMPPPPSDLQQSPQTPVARHAPVQHQHISPLQAPIPDSVAMNAAAREAEEARKEAESMRDALRKEKLEFERARREMQEMRAEMERLKLERESFAVPLPQTASTSTVMSALPPSYGQKPHAPVHTTVHASKPLPSASAPLADPSVGSSVTQASSQGSGHGPAAPPPRVAVQANKPSHTPTPPPAPSQVPPSQPMQTHAPTTPAPIPSAVANREKPIELGEDDDDIWDQPSPKASAVPGPSNVPGIGGTNTQSQDSDSSDDDDDFWGAAMAPKPTLGPAGGQKTEQNGSKGFGGSELDDWIF